MATGSEATSSPRASGPPSPPMAPPARPRRKGRPHPRWDEFVRTWYFFRRNGLAVAGLVILVAFAALFVYGLTYPASDQQMQEYCLTNGPPSSSGCSPYFPSICTYTVGTPPPGPNCYATTFQFPAFVPPTATLNPLGLGPLPLGSLALHGGDQYVYNVYAGLVKGSIWSISISVAIVGAGALAGMLLGAVSGYYGGVIDEVLMRVTDVFLSIPAILLVIVVVIAGANLGVETFTDRVLLVIAAFTVTWWPLYARVVRGQVLVLREQKYVEAAKASGASGGRIIARHMMPNSLYPVFVQMSLDVGTVPLLIAAIVFIGFTTILPSQMPEWGTIAAESTTALPNILLTCAAGSCVIPWWQILFPGLALFLFAISVNFFADGLRDALDPRLRR